MPDRATLARHLEALRATAAGFYQASPESAPSPGRVVLLRCPSAWKTPELVWGQPSADAFLQRRIKETFDPKYVFTPAASPPAGKDFRKLVAAMQKLPEQLAL
jgi:hypothetical protein